MNPDIIRLFSPSAVNAKAKISDFQLVLPYGVYQTEKYGKLNFTRDYCDQLVMNFDAKVMHERDPFVDTDHDQGVANGWIIALRAGATGLEAQVKWTDVGEENVRNERYKYWSASIYPYLDIITGKEIKPVLQQLSLTNIPQMDNMPSVKLNAKVPQAGGAQAGGAGDTTNSSKEEHTMDYEALKLSVKETKLDDAQKAEMAKLLGIEAPAAVAAPEADLKLTAKIETLETEVETLKLANKSLADRVTEQNEKISTRDQNEIIELALKDGRIIPADVEKWREKLKKAPEVVAPIIAELPKIMNFDVKGSGKDATDTLMLSAEDKEAAKRLGMTDDEYLVTIGKKKAPAKPDEKK